MAEREDTSAEGQVPFVTLPLSWEEPGHVPILYADHFLLQRSGERSYLLNAGVADIPLVAGTEAEREEMLKSIPFVPVNVIGRFGMSEETLDALGRIIVDFLAKIREDRAQREETHD